MDRDMSPGPGPYPDDELELDAAPWYPRTRSRPDPPARSSRPTTHAPTSGCMTHGDDCAMGLEIRSAGVVRYPHPDEGVRVDLGTLGAAQLVGWSTDEPDPPAHVGTTPHRHGDRPAHVHIEPRVELEGVIAAGPIVAVVAVLCLAGVLALFAITGAAALVLGALGLD